jgi:hypothetical protein
MAGFIGKSTSSLLDLLFGKQKAVELGPPGQKAAGELERRDWTEEKKGEWELANVAYDPNDPSDITPIYESWDKIE